MEQNELINNLQVIIDYFEKQLENAETTDDYQEFYIAVKTLKEIQERLLTVTSLAYSLKMLVNGI